MPQNRISNGAVFLLWVVENETQYFIWHNGKRFQLYIDPDNTTGKGVAKVPEINAMGEVSEEIAPSYIVLGHELIHALQVINGGFPQGDVTRVFDGTTVHLKEAKATGIDYYTQNGELITVPYGYGGTLTENGLRIENGLNLRVSYWNLDPLNN